MTLLKKRENGVGHRATSHYGKSAFIVSDTFGADRSYAPPGAFVPLAPGAAFLYGGGR